MTETALDPTRHSAGGVGELIVSAVERHGPRVAFLAGGRAVTYAAFGADVARTIGALGRLGLRRGDTVMQLAANRCELVAFVRDAEGPVLAPKGVSFVDALPLTVLGKVDRTRLREPFWTREARSVA